jgi:hypothetical protein
LGWRFSKAQDIGKQKRKTNNTSPRFGERSRRFAAGEGLAFPLMSRTQTINSAMPKHPADALEKMTASAVHSG